MRNKSTDEICELFDVHQQTILAWTKRGLPFDGGGRGNPRRFDEKEVAFWMKRNGVTGQAGAKNGEGASDELRAVRIRKEAALAERYELELQRTKGLMVLKSEVEAVNVKKFTIIRNKMLGLPSAVAPMLVGMDAASIDRQLDERIREVLMELSRT